MTHTVITERDDGTLLFTAKAHVVHGESDLKADIASYWEPDQASPFLKWIVGDYAEADNPNENSQFWTAGDLAMAEYSVRYAPLNMLHNFGTPIGFFVSTKTIPLERSDSGGTLKIQALSAMWSHLFPMETEIIEQASDQGTLFYSMECRSTHVHCAGPNGCDRTFDYMAADDHCSHLRDRTSIRHLVNPTFRGGALIVPPVSPGWKEAKAQVLEGDGVRRLREEDLLLQSASSMADVAMSEHGSLAAGTVSQARAWESAMELVLGMQAK